MLKQSFDNFKQAFGLSNESVLFDDEDDDSGDSSFHSDGDAGNRPFYDDADLEKGILEVEIDLEIDELELERWEAEIDASGAFHRLPDEVLVNILPYIGLDDLVHFSMSCKRAQRISEDKEILRRLAKRAGFVSTVNVPKNLTKNYYKEEYLKWRKREKQKLMLAAAAEKTRLRHRKMTRGKCCYALMYNRCIEWFMLISFFVACVMAVVKLDQGDVTSAISWVSMLCPLWVVVCQCFTGQCSFELCRRVLDYDMEDDMHPEARRRRPSYAKSSFSSQQNRPPSSPPAWGYFSPVCQYYTYIAPWRNDYQLITYYFFPSLAVALFLFLLRFTADVAISWVVILLPIDILLLVSAQVPVTGCFSDMGSCEEDSFFDRLGASISCLLFFVQSILLSLKLDHTIAEDVPWSSVFLPMWIWFGGYILWMCVGGICLIGIFDVYCISDRTEFDDCEECMFLNAFFLVVCLPIFITLLLLTLVLDGEREYTAGLVFLPMIIQLAVCLLGFLAIQGKHCDND